MSDQSLDKSKCIDGSYGWVVVLFTMLVGFVPGSNMAKAISLAPIVCMNFQINEATFGLIVASFYIMGFIMAFPTTGLVNKLGMKGSVAIAVGCGIIGSIMGAMAGTNLTVFVVSRVIEGASFGIMGVVGASSIGPWFSPKKRSLPLSIWSMWVAVCMCVCPILFGWLNESMGVDMAGIWWGTAVYDLVVGILFILFYRRPLDLDKVENEEDPTGTKKASISRALKSPMLWALALIFLFDEAAFMAINGFIVQYLTTQLDASLVLANAIFSLFGLMGALTPPISGWITQKWNNHRWVLLVGLFVAVIYTALVFQLKDPMLYYPLSILAGIVGGAVPSILWQFTPNTVEDADIPAANAFMAFTQNIGMTIGALIIGNAIVMWGWSMGSLIGMVPPVHHLPHHLLRLWRPEEAQALVCFACEWGAPLGAATPFARSLSFV